MTISTSSRQALEKHLDDLRLTLTSLESSIEFEEEMLESSKQKRARVQADIAAIGVDLGLHEEQPHD